MTRTTTYDGVVLTDRNTLAVLLKGKKIYDTEGIARITGYHVRYIRRLCANKTVDHHELLGRYYMTPDEVARLLHPVKGEDKRAWTCPMISEKP